MILYASFLKYFYSIPIFLGLALFHLEIVIAQKAIASTLEVSCTLPFSQDIGRQDAEVIAKSFAYVQVLNQAQNNFKNNKAISLGIGKSDLRLSIAAIFYDFNFTNSQLSYASTSGDIKVTVTISNKKSSIYPNASALLLKQDLLELQLELIKLTQEYAKKGHKLILIHAGIQKNNTGLPNINLQNNIISIASHLKALWLYNEALKHFQETWVQPEKVYRVLQSATTLAPSIAALWAAIGEVQLQMDQPQNALQNLNQALSLEPNRARSLYVRGLGHLRLQQPALAKTDLDLALMYKPQMTTWLRARGAIALVLEDYSTMCADFEQACSLGDCEGLAHARERNLCLK